MKKKVFTLALLAVFVLAQFSMASATAEAGAVTAIAALPTFHNTGDITLDWSVTGMDGTGTQNLFLWARSSTSLYTNWDDAANFCWGPINLNTLTNANGTYVFHTDDTADDDQDVVEFMATVSDQANCTNASADVSASDPAQASTFIDAYAPEAGTIKPPLDVPAPAEDQNLSCNTAMYWAIALDDPSIFTPIPFEYGYSGIKDWHASTTGTFAPPAPEGPAYLFLDWPFSLPSTASGMWTVSVQPEDYVGNQDIVVNYFRDNVTVVPSELEDCASFSDVSGHADEIYINYLADLGLISGFADGTFKPDNTLTRAEAATLFEISNGYDATMLPPSAPSAACTFTDVSASDWFAGWVWQACADGFMNGIGGGLFDPNNLLTRGQVVTIMNNISNMMYTNPAVLGGYVYMPNMLYEMIDAFMSTGITGIREAAWTDVHVGDYYADGVVRTYGWGITEGTSATTFSPDQPATRGEFAKWLYRALGRIY